MIAAAFVLVVSLMLATTAVALSNNGPHEGTFITLSDACAGCHRAHTAVAPKLLKNASPYNLCMSCHDGSGANTKETTGVYLGTANGTMNAGLRAGGFEQALLNVGVSASFNQTGTPAPITSRHSVNATSTIAWGFNQTGVGANITAALTCINCHNPHGNTNYRILKAKPNAITGYNTTLNAVNITGNASDNYTIVYSTTNYTRRLDLYGNNSSSAIGDWCAQCHTRYLASTGSATTNSSSVPYLFRHKTNGLDGECFSCHMAHGTSANMTGMAASSTTTNNITWPDGNTAKSWQTTYGESQYSRLLTINNRGVCMQCHSLGALTGF